MGRISGSCNLFKISWLCGYAAILKGHQICWWMVTFMLGFLVLSGSCTKEPVTVLSDVTSGSITGKVCIKKDVPAEKVSVTIAGCNAQAITDTNGYFLIPGLPAGEYAVKIGDTAIVASVVAGMVTDIGTVIPMQLCTYCCPEVISFFVKNHDGTMAKNTPRIPGFFGAHDDTVSVTAYLSYYGDDFPGGPYRGYAVVRRNTEKPVTLFCDKGRITIDPFRRRERDTLSVSVPGCMLDSQIIIVDTTAIALHRCARLFLASECIDWDVLLVNTAAHDTCSWRNRNPDWGIAAASIDNPLFRGDEVSMFGPEYWTFTQTRYFGDESIEILELPEGSYTMLVRFADGPVDSTRAMPQLDVRLGTLSADGRTSAHYVLKPLETIGVGETWVAGKIDSPAMTVDPLGNRIDTIPSAGGTL
jgi:hypothetical protein